ncbi:hypothetical protein B0H16DRAFT_1461221 [Mycena metata]|uniref:Uncharacterized protein n=1 Tax=Mycena metata TaxID=1033252 RepID=A0AAD7ITJ2_9AGAR|nr:hypothetical protein B0H16DRAFT_1461221 [Mycena metata]
MIRTGQTWHYRQTMAQKFKYDEFEVRERLGAERSASAIQNRLGWYNGCRGRPFDSAEAGYKRCWSSSIFCAHAPTLKTRSGPTERVHWRIHGGQSALAFRAFPRPCCSHAFSGFAGVQLIPIMISCCWGHFTLKYSQMWQTQIRSSVTVEIVPGAAGEFRAVTVMVTPWETSHSAGHLVPEKISGIKNRHVFALILDFTSHNFWVTLYTMLICVMPAIPKNIQIMATGKPARPKRPDLVKGHQREQPVKKGRAEWSASALRAIPFALHAAATRSTRVRARTPGRFLVSFFFFICVKPPQANRRRWIFFLPFVLELVCIKIGLRFVHENSLGKAGVDPAPPSRYPSGLRDGLLFQARGAGYKYTEIGKKGWGRTEICARGGGPGGCRSKHRVCNMFSHGKELGRKEKNAKRTGACTCPTTSPSFIYGGGAQSAAQSAAPVPAGGSNVQMALSMAPHKTRIAARADTAKWRWWVRRAGGPRMCWWEKDAAIVGGAECECAGDAAALDADQGEYG